MKVSLNDTYATTLAVIERAVAAILTQSKSDYTVDVYSFENDMNALSGAIAGLDPSLRQQIRNAVEVVVWGFNSKGFEVKLTDSLYNSNVSHGTTEVIRQQGKKLYPLTTSMDVEVYTSGSSVANTTGPTVALVTEDANTIATLADDLPEEIDEVFTEIDAEEVVEEPLALSENEFTPLISNSLIELAQTAAEYEELQDGLVTFSSNPLEDLIGTTKDLFLYYTENNYANLNTALSVIYADSNLTGQYKELRESIGGADGRAGCVSQMDFLLEHTNRLSGLILDVDSPNDVTDNDSTDEFIYTNDFSGGPAVIFSFDARYFRSATYTVQATAAALDRGHQVTTLIILNDNFHCYTRETATVYSQDPFVTFTSRLLNNRVEILATTTAANTDFVIHGVRLRIARASRSYGEMSQTKIIENHESLQSYLNDGVDYVSSQSQSLLRGDLTASLAQLFNDMLITFTNGGFLGLSTAEKQAGLLDMATKIKTARQAIQDRIDADYAEFVRVRKLVEALDTAYSLATSYSDSSGNAIPEVTLNSATKTAITESE